LGVRDVDLKRECFLDQTLQAFVAFGEVLGGFRKVKGEGGGCRGHCNSIPETAR
jgi:hypothetical protein